MAYDEIKIKVSTKYVESAKKLFGDIEITSPHMLPFAGKSAIDGHKAIRAFKKIKAFAIKEIKKLK